jgi:hypothetical protein
VNILHTELMWWFRPKLTAVMRGTVTEDIASSAFAYGWSMLGQQFSDWTRAYSEHKPENPDIVTLIPERSRKPHTDHGLCPEHLRMSRVEIVAISVC